MAKAFGTNTALTVTALQSLANNAYWQSAVIDNGAGAHELEVFLTIVTTTTAGAATGSIGVFLAGSVDAGTDFAGGASGSQGAYTDSGDVDPLDLRFLGSMACDASETTARTYKWHGVFNRLPEDFSLVLRNLSGAALGAASNAVEYRLNTY